MREQERDRMKTIQYNKQMDRLMLNNAKKEIEQEKNEKKELKKKIELQKV